MEKNNFDQFEIDLLIEKLNHRYGEEPIDRLPLYLITWACQLSMSIMQLNTQFGPQARKRLERWFEIDEGVKGRNSSLRFHSGVGFELYLFLKAKGPEVFNRLRRDMDGVLDSWVGTQEFKIEKMRDGPLKAAKFFFDKGSDSPGEWIIQDDRDAPARDCQGAS